MARIPYPDPSSYEGQPLVERIRRERGGQLLNLYRMLLHSPSVTEGWLAFLTAIRHETELPGRYRELAILRVAVLNGAEYEFEAHVSHALEAGMSQEKIEALRRGDIDRFSFLEKLVLQYTDAMTQDLVVPEALYPQLDKAFDAKTLVELTATIAGYNMVSRFLIAMRIH